MTKTRLEQIQVIEAANESAGRTVVRSLRILPPSGVPAPPKSADADPAPAPADRAGRRASPARHGPYVAAPPGRSDRGCRRIRGVLGTPSGVPHPRVARQTPCHAARAGWQRLDSTRVSGARRTVR
nr:hypothetical protein [Streptomyces sp. GMY02]